MSKSNYYTEFTRNSFEIEQHFGNPNASTATSTTNAESTEDNLLTDYELVTNEELDEETTNFDRSSTKETVSLSDNYQGNRNDMPKLNIVLDVEQIALKSHNTQVIDKSTQQEAETQKQPLLLESAIAEQQTQQQQQNTSLPYTIIPIDVTHSKAYNGNILPDTALNSFRTKNSAATSKKSATVTFRTPLKPAADLSNARQQEQQQHPRATSYPPILLLPSESAAASDSIQTVLDKSLQHETYEDTELNSQPGSSTSPESYVDHVLSAASSVSMRSSSLSSGTEVTNERFPVVGMSSSAITAGRGTELKVFGVPMKKQQLRPMAANATTANRTLNSFKSSVLNTMCSVRQPSIAAAASTTVAVAEGGMESREKKHIYQHQSTVTSLPPSASETSETISNHSRNSSPNQINSIRADSNAFPEELKCFICSEVFCDPRTLNCLHSFCFQCLVDENFKHDNSIPFWSQPGAAEADWNTHGTVQSQSIKSSKETSPERSLSNVTADNIPSAPERQRSSFSFRRKKSLQKPLLKSKSDGRSSSNSSPIRLQKPSAAGDAKRSSVLCKVCRYDTEMPLGGLRQLPQNFLLVRKIEEFKLTLSERIITRIWCSLCFEETNATYHCVTCTLNLCTLCKEAHERQRSTTDHHIRNIMELRKIRNKTQNGVNDKSRFKLKCSMHPGFEVKSFCTICLQLACTDCLVLLHKGHKHEPIAKASTKFSKLLRESTDQIQPLCLFAQHSIERLNEIAKKINRKCDDIQGDVEDFMTRYCEAVEVHRKTLLQQVQRARESKVEMVLEHQLDLEKRTSEAMDAVRFSQELTELGSDVDLLSFVSILLKRFEFCSRFKVPQDPKISESLHFLPHIRAPSTRTQNNIPLFGIITMQTVEPALCTVATEGFTHLRLHRKVEFLLQARDADGVSLCHGGLRPKAHLKYKEFTSKTLPVEVSDERDGTYIIAFVPDTQGTISLTITINDKPIKDSPFIFLARTVRPHNGIYHCCAFCSSKGSKLARCSCQGRMPGFNGCGHGHTGHPGRRHWSCCGNVLENSECSMANKLLNT